MRDAWTPRAHIKQSAFLSRSAPVLAACTAVVMMSSAPVLMVSVSAPAPAIVLARLWTAVPMWYLVIAVTGGRISRDVMRISMPMGLLFGASLAFGIVSFRATSIANATLIPSLVPVAIMILAAWLYGERRSTRDVIQATCAVGGVAIVVLGAGKTSGASTFGDLMALVNLCIFVAYMLRLKTIRDAGVPVMTYMFSMVLWAAIVVTPWTLITTGRDIAQINGWDWALVIGANISSLLVGHGLMTWSQASLDVSISALLQLGAPVVSMIGAWWVHDQRLEPIQFVGGAVVLVSLAGIVRRSSRPQVPLVE